MPHHPFPLRNLPRIEFVFLVFIGIVAGFKFQLDGRAFNSQGFAEGGDEIASPPSSPFFSDRSPELHLGYIMAAK